jgi:very-short-patch-repair endonuclease
MDAADLETLMRQQGGVARRRDLLRLVTAEDIDTALADGLLTETSRGRYSSHDATVDVVAAHAAGGVLGGLSAAQHWGWAVKHEPKRPVVIVPRNRSLVRGDLEVRRRDLPPGSVDAGVLNRVHTVVDCARTLPFDEALSVADSALRSGTVKRRDLLDCARASPRSGRPRAVRVAEAADPRADNPFETVTRAIALEIDGLRVQPQVGIGSVGRVDLADEQLRIAIECESWAYHGGAQPFRVDVRRYTRLVCTGWLVVRFVWEDVMFQPGRVRADLEAVVALRRGQVSSLLPRHS